MRNSLSDAMRKACERRKRKEDHHRDRADGSLGCADPSTGTETESSFEDLFICVGTCMHGSTEARRLDLELQVVLSCPARVLGTELGSPAKSSRCP